MERLPKKVTRKALLKLPSRKWDQTAIYDWLYLVPTGRKHDSGYMQIAIVGVEQRKTGNFAELAAWQDDIGWSFPLKHPYDRHGQGVHKTVMRTDCEFPSGIMRIWASGEHYFKGRFKVGCALSSTDVSLILVPEGDGRNQMTGEVFAATPLAK